MATCSVDLKRIKYNVRGKQVDSKLLPELRELFLKEGEDSFGANLKANQVYNFTSSDFFRTDIFDWKQAQQFENYPIDLSLVYEDTLEPVAELAVKVFNERQSETAKRTVLLDNFKNATQKIIDNLDSQLKYLSFSSSENKDDITNELNKIKKELEEKKTIIGIINYINFVKNTLDKYKTLFTDNIEVENQNYVVSIKKLINSFANLEDLAAELSKLAKGITLDELYEGLTEDEKQPLKSYTSEILLKEVNELLEEKRNLLNIYNKHALETSSLFLKAVSGKYSLQELTTMLLRSKELNDISRWFLGIKNVNNDVASLFAKHIVEIKNNARRLTDEKVLQINKVQKNFIEYMKQLRPNINIDNYVQLYDLFLEKTEDGRLTGKETQKFNEAKFYSDKIKLLESLEQEKENETKKESKARKKRNYEKIKYFIDNSVDKGLYLTIEKDYIDKLKEITRSKTEEEKEYLQKKFDEWVQENVSNVYELNNGQVQVTPKLSSYSYVRPNDKYLNKDYKFIYQKDSNGEYIHKPLVEAYEMYTSLKRQHDNVLPKKFRKRNEVLSVRKNMFNVLMEDGIEGYINVIKNNLKVNKVEEHELGQQDVNGDLVNHVPIFFTSKVINPDLYTKEKLEELNGNYLDIKETSLNLFDNLKYFIEMSNNYKGLNDISYNIEMLKDTINQSEVIEKDFQGNFKKAKTGEGSNLSKCINDWIASNVYGQAKLKESWGKVNFKIIDKVMQLGSFTTLGFNMFSPVSNLLNATTFRRIAAFGSPFYNNSDFNFAHKEYLANNTLDLINDYFNLEPKNKINLLRQLFLLDRVEKTFSKLDRNLEKAGIKALGSTFNNMVEHYVSSLSMIAILKNKGLYDKIEVVDGKLVLPKEFNLKEINATTHIIKEEIKSKDGAYSQEDKGAVARTLIGRAVMQYRNWMIPTIMDRFAFQMNEGKIEPIYNNFTETEKKGYYISLGQFGYQIYKELFDLKGNLLSLSIKGEFNKLTDLDKKNIYKALTEIGYLLATLALCKALKAASDDDKDNQLLSYFSYQADRLNTEIGFYVPVLGTNDVLKILNSPAITVSQVQSTLEIMDNLIWEYDETYESGEYKGENKLGIKILKQTPVIKQIMRFNS